LLLRALMREAVIRYRLIHETVLEDTVMLTIDLSGRTALVTGATGQLGRVIARTLAEAGADVVVHCHRRFSEAEALACEIRKLKRSALAVAADLTETAEVAALKARVEQELRLPDVLVVNAVIQYSWTSVLQQPVADYESQYRACVRQAVLLAQAFVPAMIDHRWGRVIGINTECAMQCATTTSAYVAGKRGMDGVLRVLAKEVGEYGITVNQVAPGWTVSADCPDSDKTLAYRKTVPLQRRGTDREIAQAVAFLASDLAGFITGVYLPVCGGNAMPAI